MMENTPAKSSRSILGIRSLKMEIDLDLICNDANAVSRKYGWSNLRSGLWF